MAVTTIYSGKYFFDQDESSLWYMIPIELRETWDRLSQVENCWEFDGWKQFEDLRLSGGISGIVFESPIKQN